jgi:hypothetical protein
VTRRSQDSIFFDLYGTHARDANYLREPGMRHLASAVLTLPDGWQNCLEVQREGVWGYIVQVCTCQRIYGASHAAVYHSWKDTHLPPSLRMYACRRERRSRTNEAITGLFSIALKDARTYISYVNACVLIHLSTCRTAGGLPACLPSCCCCVLRAAVGRRQNSASARPKSS